MDTLHRETLHNHKEAQRAQPPPLVCHASHVCACFARRYIKEFNGQIITNFDCDDLNTILHYFGQIPGAKTNMITAVRTSPAVLQLLPKALICTVEDDGHVKIELGRKDFEISQGLYAIGATTIEDTQYMQSVYLKEWDAETPDDTYVRYSYCTHHNQSYA